MKSSIDLLREYSTIIKEAEEDFDASDFDSNEPDDFEEMNRNEADDYRNEFDEPSEDMTGNTENNPVQELADYIDNYKDDTADWSTVIAQFLKDNHYDLVPTNSLENSTGNV